MLMVANVNMTVYWNVMPCSLVDKVPSFERNHLPLSSFYDNWGSGLLLHVSVSLPNHADSHKTGDCAHRPCKYGLSANSTTSYSDRLYL